MMNPEGLFAVGGHALAVSRTAQWLSEREFRVGGVWREELAKVAALDPSPRERFLAWTGDRLIAVGAWLKGRAVQPRYQQA